MSDVFTRKIYSSDLLIGGILGSVFTVTIGLFVSQIVTAEIVWGLAFIFIVILITLRR